MKPEFIKLDKSLIRNIDKHPKQQYLVELLLEFALQSDTSIIAEGIETVAELRFLKKLGIHLGQGYALGKPMPQLYDGHLPRIKTYYSKKISIIKNLVVSKSLQGFFYELSSCHYY